MADVSVVTRSVENIVEALEEGRFYSFADAGLAVMRRFRTRPASKGEAMLMEAVEAGAVRLFQVDGDGAIQYEYRDGKWSYGAEGFQRLRLYLNSSGHTQRESPDRPPRKNTQWVVSQEVFARIAGEYQAAQQEEDERREASRKEIQAEDEKRFAEIHPRLAEALAVIQKRDPEALAYGYTTRAGAMHIEVRGETARWLAELVLNA